MYPFSGAGDWLLVQLIHGEQNRIGSVFVATYWFGFLVFVLASWILHRRLAQPWVPAQLAALLIAGLATTLIVWVSHLHE